MNNNESTSVSTNKTTHDWKNEEEEEMDDSLMEEDISIHQKWSEINELKELFGFAH